MAYMTRRPELALFGVKVTENALFADMFPDRRRIVGLTGQSLPVFMVWRVYALP
jgi:hypothetical protein